MFNSQPEGRGGGGSNTRAQKRKNPLVNEEGSQVSIMWKSAVRNLTGPPIYLQTTQFRLNSYNWSRLSQVQATKDKILFFPTLIQTLRLWVKPFLTVYAWCTPLFWWDWALNWDPSLSDTLAPIRSYNHSKLVRILECGKHICKHTVSQSQTQSHTISLWHPGSNPFIQPFQAAERAKTL